MLFIDGFGGINKLKLMYLKAARLPPLNIKGFVAQLEEQLNTTQQVRGSNPFKVTNDFVAQWQSGGLLTQGLQVQVLPESQTKIL